MFRHEDRWVVSADELLAANPGAHVDFIHALRAWSGTEVTVYAPVADAIERVFEINGDLPLPNGSYGIAVESLNVPSSAKRPLRWDVIAPVGIGVVVLAGGAFLWSRRRQRQAPLRAVFAAPDKRECCPSRAIQNRWTDKKGKSRMMCRSMQTNRIVSPIPCPVPYRQMRRVGIPEPFPKARW